MVTFVFVLWFIASVLGLVTCFDGCFVVWGSFVWFGIILFCLMRCAISVLILWGFTVCVYCTLLCSDCGLGLVCVVIG